MKICFVLGVFDEEALQRGQVLTEETFEMLQRTAAAVSADAEIVFAVPDEKWAGRAKDVKVKTWRESREQLIRDIQATEPDMVYALGTLALQALVGRGNATQKSFRRREFKVPDLGDTPCFTSFGVEQWRMKSGYARWIGMDLMAAVRGQSETHLPEYTVLKPDTPEWSMVPEDLVDHIDNGGGIGFDLETYPGLFPTDPGSRIRMAIISWREGQALIVQATSDSRFPPWLQGLIESDVPKYGSNIKFDYRWLDYFGLELHNMRDTATAEHVLDERNPQKGLKDITFTYAPRLGDYSRDHQALVDARGGWEFVGDEEQYDYAACDGDASYSAGTRQEQKLRERGVWLPYDRVMMPLYQTLARMEARGMCIDLAENRRLHVRYETELASLRNKLRAEFGPINPNSPDQVKAALLKVVPNIDLRFDKRGEWIDEELTTNAAILEREQEKHPIIKDLLNYRRMHKRWSVYVDKFQDKLVRTGNQYFVHGSFRTDTVETFRLSSNSPNLQNIPRNFEVDKLTPEEIEKLQAMNIKNQFVSRFKDGWFMEVDQSQLEIRVAAWQSMDPTMMEVIARGGDLHRDTASVLLKKAPDLVTKDERQRFKQLNFGILYGMGAKRLSAALGVSKDMAQRYIDEYFEGFSGLANWIERTKERVKVDLMVETAFGFKRYFDEPYDWDSPAGWRIERQAVNTKIQSPAATIVQLGMVQAERVIIDECMQTLMTLQVHDSAGLEVPDNELRHAAEIMRWSFENTDLSDFGIKLPIPLVADVEVGRNWGSKKPYDK